MKLVLIVAFSFILGNALAQSNNGPIKKSMILFTQQSGATTFNYGKYKADGVFWGHMPNSSIESDRAMDQWVENVENRTSDGKYHFGRGEFDWGWKWMIDFMDDPESYWAKDLNGNNINWTNNRYKGHTHSWQSHHGPDFLAWLKYQVDRMTLAPVTHMMFDSQTSATRTVHWLAGDFSIHSMNGFRAYMKEKYSIQELRAMGINDINSFNYRRFLLDRGFTARTYRNRAISIEGNIPLYKDFVYFQRQSLNEVMEELFAYVDTIRPGIAVGATTNLIEPRGFVFSDRMTYLAGEYGHPHDAATSPPFEPILHYKAAESLDKTLIYFPYPDAFKALQDRDAPRQSRAWIAQAYAMGSIFTIPGTVWVGSGTWNTGWKNHADIYELVHDHSELFDDYKAVSNVAMAYSVYASLLVRGMQGSAKANETLAYLMKENISFDLKIFGDPDRPIAPTKEELEPYDVIVHDSDIQYLTEEQNKILNANGSKVVSVENPNGIASLLSWKIDVLREGEVRNELISALPRASKDKAAPYVLHLINRKYNPSIDNAQTHRGISVKIPSTVFNSTTIEGAKLHLPGKASVDLSFKIESGIMTLDIGTFEDCWGIVEFDHTLSNDDVSIDSESISLYPNPANKYVTIKNASTREISSVEVYNVEGKRIMSNQVNSNTLNLNISALAKGVYIVKINSISGGTAIKKLIKN